MMKLKYGLFLFTLIFLFVFSSKIEIKAQGQDTVVVEWQDDQGNFLIDNLRFVIEQDTPRVDGRVYKLRKGGFYWITETITNNGWPLRLVGETPDPNDAGGFPAVLQRVARTDGTVTGRLITGGGSITMKNLYVINSTDGGVQTDYQPFQIDASNSRFIFDNCVFERTNFASIAFTASNNDIFITNCVFRNQIEKPVSQQWAGRGVSIWADQDTVIVDNNTFFNVGMTAFQQELGNSSYLRFNHNTLVDIGRGMFATPWLKDAYVANNLLINVFWHGEGYADLHGANRDPRATTSGMFGFGDLPTKYGTEDVRRVLFANNAAWRDPYFATKYADSIAAQPFINRVLKEDFVDPLENVVVVDTMWLADKPDFGYYVTTDIMDTMWASINGIRTNNPYKPTYFVNLVIDPDLQEICNTCPYWPVEDFSYSTASLMQAGTDNLPLGNLNYFPTAMADYEANKDAYAQQLFNMAGSQKVDEVVVELQAEDGTLADGAQLNTFTGDAWYTLTGGTNVEWTFNSSYAGPIDIMFNARADGSNIGFDCILNGTNFVDAARGWGQFVFWTGADDPQTFWSGKTTTDFYEVTYLNADLKTPNDATTPSVVAGDNTLKLQYSWNDISFKKVVIYEAGTSNIVATLGPADAVNNGATPAGVGTFVPVGFKSVILGTTGSTTLNFDIAESGDYLARLFFQNPNAGIMGALSIDGTEVSSIDYAQEEDSTTTNSQTDLFALTSGSHTLKVTGDVNLDWLQLIKRTTITDVKHENLPDGYELSQNYPNPFNPSTTINFSIGKTSNVKLIVYNILGQKVATLLDRQLKAGAHVINFNAGSLSSGVYFYGIETNGFKFYKKMMLLK